MKKISLKNAENALSRAEMKSIMAGRVSNQGFNGCNARASCSTGCASYTNAEDTAGYCSTCCIA